MCFDQIVDPSLACGKDDKRKSRGPWKKGPRPHLTSGTAVLQ